MPPLFPRKLEVCAFALCEESLCMFRLSFGQPLLGSRPEGAEHLRHTSLRNRRRSSSNAAAVRCLAAYAAQQLARQAPLPAPRCRPCPSFAIGPAAGRIVLFVVIAAVVVDVCRGGLTILTLLLVLLLLLFAALRGTVAARARRCSIPQGLGEVSLRSCQFLGCFRLLGCNRIGVPGLCLSELGAEPTEVRTVPVFCIHVPRVEVQLLSPQRCCAASLLREELRLLRTPCLFHIYSTTPCCDDGGQCSVVAGSDESGGAV
mmetsp:Transcript_119312/g.297653  ORF Transcript_119312/g.297653 Transcript_119312/m.297653 type:complete len:260 (+) Transcript_119312:341-1120(+)